MGSLSAGFACHHCDDLAPTEGREAYFKYLTTPDNERLDLEPSCREHATHFLQLDDEDDPHYLALVGIAVAIGAE